MVDDFLVTVGVITYNSSEFVLETLESIKNQTYKNIELIISDDASTDNTVDICNSWIEKNRSVLNVRIITTLINTGTSGNCNRILNSCNGLWLKIIAGDDLLVPDAIEKYVDFVRTDSQISHVVANIKCFNRKGDLNIDERAFTRYMCRKEATVKEQYSVITKMFFGDGPSYFVRKAALIEVGSYDERFPLQEDYPLYMRMIKAGYRLYQMNALAVKYRIRDDSVSHNSDDESLFPNNFVRIVRDYRFLYRKEHSNSIWKLFHWISLLLCDAVIVSGNSRKSLLSRLFFFIYKILDPYRWFGRYMTMKMERYNRIKLSRN